MHAKPLTQKRKKDSVTGFTLIELLLVIAIIGILSSIVMASLFTVRKKARDARRVVEMQQMVRAITLSDTGFGNVAFGGCTAANAKVNTCSGNVVGLAAYADPAVGTGGAACSNSSSAVCQYSVSQHTGAAGAHTGSWQICGYFETAYGPLLTPTGGPVSVRSNTGGVIAGCN